MHTNSANTIAVDALASRIAISIDCKTNWSLLSLRCSISGMCPVSLSSMGNKIKCKFLQNSSIFWILCTTSAVCFFQVGPPRCHGSGGILPPTQLYRLWQSHVLHLQCVPCVLGAHWWALVSGMAFFQFSIQKHFIAIQNIYITVISR